MNVVKEVYQITKYKVLAMLLLCLSAFSPFAFGQQGQQSSVIFPAAVMTATSQTSSVIHLSSQPFGTPVSYSTGTITVTGTSLTTATFAVNGSSDGGKTYYALNISAINAPATTATTETVTTAGVYQVNLSGITDVEFVTSGTFTATNISLTLTASPNGIIARTSGGGSVTWPTSGDAVVSNGTNTPTGLAPVNGDCMLGSGGAWTVGACGSGTVTSIGVTTANGVSGTSSGGATPSLTLSLGAINPSSTGATTPGTGAFTAVNNTVHVDPANLSKWTGSDYGSWVNAAIASLPTSSGHPVGQVILDPPATAGASSITQTTEVSLDLTYLSVIGPNNPAVLQITCSISTVCWNTFTSSSLTPNRSGSVGGFTLIGVGSNTSAIGMQSGGCWYGCTFENITIQGFTGASAIGWLWENPAGTQSERVTIQNVQLGSFEANNTTDMKFADVHSAPDFDYWDVQSLRMTVGNTDTGIDVENDCSLTGQTWRLTVNTNATSGTTYIFKVNGTSNFGSVGAGAGAAEPFPPAMNVVNMNFDASTQAGNVTVWTVASGAYVGISGPIAQVIGSATWSNAISGGFVNFASGLVVAPVVLKTQTADISYVQMYTVPPSGGLYEACIDIAVTRAATSTSTLPAAGINFNRGYDNYSNNPSLTVSKTTNALYSEGNGCYMFQGYPGSVVEYFTSGYASSGATSMQFAMTVTLRLLQ